MKCIMCQEACHQGPTIWDYLAWGPLPESVLCRTCQDLWQTKIEGQVICWGCGRALSQEAQDPYHAVAIWQDQHVYCQECQAWLSRYPIDLIHHQALYPYQGARRSHRSSATGGTPACHLSLLVKLDLFTWK